MNLLDSLIACLYIAATVFGALALAAYRNRSKVPGPELGAGAGNSNDDAIWLGDNRFSAFFVAFTIMATFVSSNTVVSHTGIAFDSGLILLPGLLALPVIAIFAAIVLIPFYRRNITVSFYEYFESRFNRVVRRYASLGFVLDRTFDMAVTLVTTCLVVQVISGLDFWVAAVAIVGFTLLYSSVGGLSAIVFGDALHGITILIVAILAAVTVFSFEGVWQAAWQQEKFSLGQWRLDDAPPSEPTQPLAWQFILAMGVIWLRRFCCDQTMVQRYLIADSVKAARQGLLFACVMILAVVIFFNLLGALIWGLYSQTGQQPPVIRDEIFPHFILAFMPLGVAGLAVAAVVCAAMSSLSSDMHAAASALCRDFLAEVSGRSLVLARCVMVAIALAIIVTAMCLQPGSDSAPLAMRVIAIASALSGTVVGLFCLGFFTVRANSTGALVGIAAGALIGLWAVFSGGQIPAESRAWWMFPWHPLLAGVASQAAVITVGYLVSCLSAAKAG